VHFDPGVAYKYSSVRNEAEHLWQESIDGKDDSIATAAAATMIYKLYGADGGKHLAMLTFITCNLS
jgi:hypothetical protein